MSFPGEDSIKEMSRREGYKDGWRDGCRATAFVVALVVGLGMLFWLNIVQ